MWARLFALAGLDPRLHALPRGGRLAAWLAVVMVCAVTSWSVPILAGSKTGKPWLGVSMSKPPGGGVRVEHVFRTSPAEKAKLKKGDELTRVDGVALNEPDDLVRHVAKHKPGMTVELTVRRGGSDRVVKAILAEHPGNDQLARLMHVGNEAYELEGLTEVSAPMPSSMQDLRGRVVVVDFFASWCQNCKAMTPALAALHQKYQSKGLTVLGVTSDEPDTAQDIVAKWKIPFAVGSDGSKQTFSAYSVTAIPAMFIIDKKGVIREVLIGFDPSESGNTEKLIKKLLAEK